MFMSCTIKIWISNWPRTRKFIQGRQSLLTFLTIITRWSRSSFTFYALIGQNLTGEFMRKMYAASWNLFTLTAEADRVLCQLVMFNCLFPLDVQNEIQLLSRFFCYSWLVCLLGFWLRIPPLVEVIGNSISDGVVFKNELILLDLAWCLRRLRSLRRFWPYLMAFRSCISTGKPE